MVPHYTKIKSQSFHSGCKALSYLALFSYFSAFHFFTFTPSTMDSLQCFRHSSNIHHWAIVLAILSTSNILVPISILLVPSLPSDLLLKHHQWCDPWPPYWTDQYAPPPLWFYLITCFLIPWSPRDPSHSSSYTLFPFYFPLHNGSYLCLSYSLLYPSSQNYAWHLVGAQKVLVNNECINK